MKANDIIDLFLASNGEYIFTDICRGWDGSHVGRVCHVSADGERTVLYSLSYNFKTSAVADTRRVALEIIKSSKIKYTEAKK